MGLFDRIRALLDGGDSGERTAEKRGAGTPPGGEGGPPTRSDPSGPAVQSHGSHWDTLVPDAGREAAIQELTMETVSEGEIIEGEPLDGATVTGHRLQDGPLGTLAVSIDQQIATSYPIGTGVDHTVETTARNEWETGIEAWLGGNLDEAAITTFASNYFQHPGEHFGGECRVSLAMLMYDFGEAEYETVVDEDGEELDVSNFAGFRPWERGAVDDYVVRTTVDAVETVSHGGFEAYRIEAPLFRTPDGRNVDAAFYVGTHLVDDYEPREGDDVEGAGWMQAWFH